MPLKFGDLEGKQAAAADGKEARKREAKIQAAMDAIRLRPHGSQAACKCDYCGKMPWEHEDAAQPCYPGRKLWNRRLNYSHDILCEAMRRIIAEGGRQ